MFTKLQTAISFWDVVTSSLYRPMHIACSATPFLSTAAYHTESLRTPAQPVAVAVFGERQEALCECIKVLIICLFPSKGSLMPPAFIKFSFMCRRL